MPYQSELILQRYFFLWRLFGMWPHPTDHWRYKLYGHGVHVTMVLIIVGIWMTVSHTSTYQELSDCVLWTMTYSMLLCKSIINISHRKRCDTIMTLLSQLERTSAESDVELRCLRQPKLKSDRLLSIMATNAVSCAFLVYVYAMFQGVTIYPTALPFGWNEIRMLNMVVATSQFVTLTAYDLVNWTVNNYGPSMFMLLSAHLDVLGMRLSKLGYEKKPPKTMVLGNMSAMQESRRLEEKLIECIEYYTICLRCANHLKKMFGIFYTVQFVFSGGMLCGTSIILSKVPPSFYTLVLLLYACVVAIELFLPCYYGTVLQTKSERLAGQLYACNWPTQTKRFKTLVMLTIHHMQSTIVLSTYKGFFVIGLPTFITVVRAAYSLFSCLNEM